MISTDPPVPFRTDTVLESLPDGFQAFDSHWRYVYLNCRAEEILGRSRADLIGKVCWEEYPDAVGTPFHAHYLEAMGAQRTVVFEDFCPHEETWVEFSLHPYPEGLGVFQRDITDRKRAERTVQQSEEHYRALFDQVLDAVVLADDRGVYVDANPAACVIFGTPREQLIGRRIVDFTSPHAGTLTPDAWNDFLRDGEQSGEFRLRRLDGTEVTLEYRARANIRPGVHLSVLRDVTERRAASERTARLVADLAEEREALDTVNRVGRLLSAELDRQKLVQAATDAATELTGAQFGAFFYKLIDPNGESYILYTISGVPREMFAQFPMPRNTPVFGPTFRGEGIIRLADVTKDERYGQMPPYHGMPSGHLPVRSYLAVPVISRSGEVLGGLFFGHAEANVFTERAERSVEALAAQVAIAMDNARLFGNALKASEQARREIEERKKAEEELRRALEAEARQVRFNALRADVSAALAEGGSLPEMLHHCAASLISHLDAALARIWTLDTRENVLVLQASAGLYTQRDGPQGRVPVGEGNIGRIAQDKKPHASNDVLTDDSLADKEWARRENMVAFAGYPLLVEERMIGVVAMFARHALAPDALSALGAVADALAQGVERKRVEQRLTESEARQRAFLTDILASVTEGKLRLCDSPADLPPSLPVWGEPVPLTEKTLRVLRRLAADAAQAAGMARERSDELLTAASEAAMNAVVHAGGGRGTVGADIDAGIVQVRVEDEGTGIEISRLPRATLDRGYTTAGTLGHGFKMALSAADRIWLLTGPTGTTVVIEQDRQPGEPIMRWKRDKKSDV